MERVALFLDHANLQGSFNRHGTQVDYVGLRDYLSEGRFLVEAFVYVPIPPHRPESTTRFIEFLQRKGFFVRPKLGKPTSSGHWKCDVDVEISIDLLRFAHEGRVDIVVLGSGDGDMAPVVQEIRYRGVRCEVASTAGSIAKELRLSANGYVDLSSVLEAETHGARDRPAGTEEEILGATAAEPADDYDELNALLIDMDRR